MAELLAEHLHIPEAEQENFMRRARGEFVPTLLSPEEMTLAEAQVPANEEETPKHNFPAQTTTFFGRVQEIADINQQLANPACRLLTILGAGGMGKTRLSIEIGKTQLGNFTDGVTYVALAPISANSSQTEINPLAGALADALKISFHAQGTPEEQLFAYLRRKEMLIVFDNFEHLLETAVFLSHLLQHAPDIKILTTSRERLNLQEEWLYPLQGLSLSGKEAHAVRLFVQRAQQVKANFDLEKEETAVLRICQLVEGMPLGVELAASWTLHLSCHEIANEIEAELDFLATDMQNVPKRQRSIRTIFSYAWEKLTTKEQTVLQKLSVFRGGFGRQAARAVAGASLPTLGKLVGKSLLSVNENGRYQMHELLRQFAADKLAQTAADEREAHSRHSQHFLSVVASAEPALKGHDILIALQTIEQDIENIRAAIRWTANHELHRFDKAFGVSLESFYFVKGWFLESESIFRLIAAKLQERCEAASHNEPIENVSDLHLLWIQYRTNLGVAQTHLGKFELAQQTHHQSLSILPEDAVAAQWARAWCLLNLGYSRPTATVEANNYFQESARLAQQAGDHWLQAISLIFMGNGLRILGDYDAAKTVLEQTLTALQQQGERVFSSFAKGNLGRLATAQGDLIIAETYHQECLAERQTLGMKMGIAFAYWDLGRVMLWQDKYQAAHDYFQQGIAFSKEANLPTATAMSLWELGNVALALEDFRQAKRYFQAHQQLHSSTRAFQITGGLGWVALGLGHYSEAEQHFITDLSNTRETQWALKGFDAFVGLAVVAAKNGQFDQALELLALVRHHPASAYENKKKANAFWQELTAELPYETAVNAEARGKKRDFLETIDQFINHAAPQS